MHALRATVRIPLALATRVPQLSRGWLLRTTRNKTTFVDRARVVCKGGAGGQGSLRQGTVGGDGGSVIVEGAGHSCLAHLTTSDGILTVKGESGENADKFRIGKNGTDAIIQVPFGTVMVTDSGDLIAEVNEIGDQTVLAYGGEGGSAITNDKFNGLKGDVVKVVFELKTIADIGLVGFPNAGKSSLLSKLSKAKPKVADYPFTTIRPNIGTLVFDDLFTAKIADIPGLIEGASQNLGMGHSFLRHIERTRMLLFVVDINGFQLSTNSQHVTALEAVRLLATELELYQPGLLQKPALLAVNKLDVPGSRETYLEFKKQLPAVLRATGLNLQTIIPVSVKADHGLDALKQLIRDQLNAHVPAQGQQHSFGDVLRRTSQM
eukprot:m.132522 g.132522  ORF g.132522 m.132522 type:complete len:378 (-) comp29610_c0_seq3:141-1274(-)